MPDPINAQAWNRYSYVGNDPLAFTDPSGYSWFSNFFRNVGHFFRNLFQRIPILRSIVQIATTIVLTPIVGPVGAAAIGAAVVTGLSGGKLGDMLRAAATTLITAVAFNAVGNLTDAVAGAPIGSHAKFDFGTPEHLFNIAGHAVIGCGTSALSGGDCGSGALSAGVTSFAGPVINGRGFVADLVANAALGGAAAVAGGGKFENGAATGAFGYLFNHLGRANTDKASNNVSDVTGADQAAVQSSDKGLFNDGATDRTINAYEQSLCQSTSNECSIDGLRAISQQNQEAKPFDIAAKRSPTFYCQNIECGEPTGGAFYPLCPHCYFRAIKPGAPIIRLENGQIYRPPLDDPKK